MSHDKVKALRDAKPPKNASDAAGLLGLAVFCERRIPNLATIVKPIRQLTRKGVPFKWGKEEQEALDKLKSSVIDSAMGYFDTSWSTHLTVDASPVGLGATLLQSCPANDSDIRLIFFASKTLSFCRRQVLSVRNRRVFSCLGL